MLNKKPFKSMPKGTFHLQIEQAIYVPSKDKNSKKFSQQKIKKMIRETKKKLSVLFGGYTSVGATGGFVSQKGMLIQERVVKVTSFSTRGQFQKNRLKLKKWIIQKKKQWKQEAIGYEFEGDLFYI
jgi:hypothetical protein